MDTTQSDIASQLDMQRFANAAVAAADIPAVLEHAIFTVLPAILLMLVTPVYLYAIYGETPFVRPSKLFRAKAAFGVSLVGVHVILLVLWAAYPALQSKVSFTAALLSCLGSVCIAVLLYAEHLYSYRPSTFLSLFLTVTLLFDATKTYAYTNRIGRDAVSGLYTSACTMKIALLISQEISKRRLISSDKLVRPLGRESSSGFWSRSLFLWMNATLFLGFRKILTMHDLPPLGPDFDSAHLLEIFKPQWRRVNKSSQFALTTACLRSLAASYSMIVVPRICYIGFTFAQPTLLFRITKAVRERDFSSQTTSNLVGSMFVVYFGIAISRAYYKHLSNQVTTLLRSILTAAIYDKMLRLGQEELKKSKAVTLINTDMINIETIVSLSHDIWSSAVELILAIVVLTGVSGPAGFLMLIPAAITTVTVVVVAKKMGMARTSWNEMIEQRVAKTSNVLSQLISIKMAGLAPNISAFLQRQRVAEICVSMQERSLRVVLHALNAVTVSITPVLIVAGQLFWTRIGEGLNSTETFTTLAIVAGVSEPLAKALVAIPFFANALASLARVQKFLCLEEVSDDRRVRNLPASNTVAGYAAIRTTNMSITSDMTGPILRDVNLQIPVGNIVMVFGPVGCGKSTLLRALLGEAKLNTGVIEAPSSPVGYCGQSVWLRNANVRDNIVNQCEFNPTWYSQVLTACGLDEDLAALPSGDQTRVGAEGSSLSGGQRQRVAIARAVYPRTPILVLDDVLSAVDDSTASVILQRLIGDKGILRVAEVTVIMTTSFRSHLQQADVVFSLNKKGRVQRLPGLARDKQKRQGARELVTAQLDESSPNDLEHPPRIRPLPSARIMPEENDDNRRKGDPTLYSYYLGSASRAALATYLVVVSLAAIADKLPQIFVRIWMQTDPYNQTYFKVYALLGAASVCFAIGTTLFFYRKIVTQTSIALHQRLLDTTMDATLSFLAETDAGLILNRFSQDMNLIAQKLPQVFMNASYTSVSILIDIAVIISGATNLVTFVPIFAVFVLGIQHFYLRTSRQLRYMDLEAKTPLYTHFIETASGIQHIRAFHWQEHFASKSLECLDYSQAPYYYHFCVQVWLGLVMDLSVCAVGTCLAYYGLKHMGITSESAIGLSLLNLVTFSSNLSHFVDSWATVEMSLGGVWRVKYFCRNTPQEADNPREPSLPGYWPSRGRIDFNCVSASYRVANQGSKQALKNISFTVQPGQKVGVAGRTGGGKSSLLYAILNMLDYSGTISIDGREARTVPRQFLRSRIITLSQKTIELHGSIRENLDPFDPPDYDSGLRLTNQTLINALTRVGLWGRIQNAGGLDADMSDANLSEGQKQLLALARAILRKSYSAARILLIDEATSHLDMETDVRMQAVIAEEFANCTVIMISHRLHAFDRMSVVLRIDEGSIVDVLKRDPETGKLVEA